MNQAIRKLSGLLVLPVLLAALLMMPVRAYAEETTSTESVAYECDVDLPVTVELNGDSDESFQVTIACDEDENAEVPLPENCTLALQGDQSGTFSMHYTEPGDYFYTVRQTVGKTQYMTYDSVVYRVQIQVTNAPKGGLQGKVSAHRDDTPKAKTEEVRFLNTYAPPAPGPAATATPTPTPAPAAPTATPTSGILPQTGDTMPLVTVVVVMLVAAAALVILFVMRKRKKNDK